MRETELNFQNMIISQMRFTNIKKQILQTFIEYRKRELSKCILWGWHIQKAGLPSEKRGVKIGGRNINNLIYADDTILLAENCNDLKQFLMKVKEGSAKAELHLNIKNTGVVKRRHCNREKACSPWFSHQFQWWLKPRNREKAEPRRAATQQLGKIKDVSLETKG